MRPVPSCPSSSSSPSPHQFAAFNSSQFGPGHAAKHHQKQFPPLPQQIVDHLRGAFRQMDLKGTGLVPYEYICYQWPLLHCLQSPIPPNLLGKLRRIGHPRGLITFQQFLHAAQLAFLEHFAMPDGNVLKRARSEEKLFLKPRENEDHRENWIMENERPKSRTSTPAMGIAGRKLDHREYSRLMKMKKASRSQPQLNELFEEGRRGPRGLRRSIDQNATIFNMVEDRDNDDGAAQHLKKSKSMKAPPPPIESPVILANGNKKEEGEEGANKQNGRANGNYALQNKGGASTRAGAGGNGNNNNGGGGGFHHGHHQQQPNNNHHQSHQQQRRPVSVAGKLPAGMNGAMGECRQMPIGGHHQHYPSRHQNQREHPFSAIGANYTEELQPQVAKHERFLEEEFKIVHSGQESAQELLAWYNGRVESLEKRKGMLRRGMVALDSAIHEQKLNFHRAQIAELNRRIKAFLASAESGGFPGHGNLPQQSAKTTTIRNQVHPPPFPPPHSSGPPTMMPLATPPHPPPPPAISSNSCSAASSSSNASSTSSSGSLPLDGAFSSASEAEFLRAQNQKLMRDVRQLAHEVEKLQLQSQFNNGSIKDFKNVHWRRWAENGGGATGGNGNYARLAKDTLL